MASLYGVGMLPTCVAQESREAVFRTSVQAVDVSGFERGHGDRIAVAAFSRDGRVLATSAADGTLIVWDVATGKALWQGKQNISATAMVFVPDPHTLMTVNAPDGVQTDRTVTYWDVRSGRRLRTLDTCPEMSSWHYAFSPDGRRLVAAVDNGDYLNGLVKSLVCWDIEAAKVVWRVEVDHVSPETIAFSPAGRKMAIGISWSATISPSV